MIQSLNHFTITAADGARTLAFYCGLLGLRDGPRPDLGFPGAWLYAGDGGTAVLHVVLGRPAPPQPTGVIDHVALTARDLPGLKARLDAAGWPYDLRRQRGSGTWQLFVHDPDGARIELDFEATETP
jgi:catechol 2,3-dioxygenase-like lactoylglutathione lyase family enzyme